MGRAGQIGIVAFVALAHVAIGPSAARAQATGSLEGARARLEFEPTVAETMHAALRYFRVDPDNFDSLRTSARTRALLPTLAAGYRFDDDRYARQEDQTISTPLRWDEQTNSRVNTISVGAVWDLRELVFNPAEVQVYGLIGVQRNIMLETTRVYYLRRQLFVRFLLGPPEDPIAREALVLRIDEFTAQLDVMTGGWFSETTNDRMRSGRRRASRQRHQATGTRGPRNTPAVRSAEEAPAPSREAAPSEPAARSVARRD